MSILLFADAYSTERSWGVELPAVTVAAPSGGTASIAEVASLRDTIIAKKAVVSFANLPAATGARAGRFGPVTITTSGAASTFSGSAFALIGHTMPARTRVEWSFGALSSPPADVLVGQDFNRARRGVSQSAAFYEPSMASGGYLTSTATPDQQAKISLYLPFGTGQFSIGRLFIGHAVDITRQLRADVQDGAADYAAAGLSKDAQSGRQRGVARSMALNLYVRPGAELQGIGRTWTAAQLAAQLAADPFCVFWPGATLAAPTPNTGDRLIHAVARQPITITDARANAQEVSLSLLEAL